MDEQKTAFGLEDFINTPEPESKDTLSQDDGGMDKKLDLNDEKTKDSEADKKDGEKAAKTDEGKAETKAKDDAEKKAEDLSPDWESDKNTYKKRYKDTSQYATIVNQHNIELKKNLERIEMKLDGTYDPEQERQAEAIPDISQAEIRGKIAASQSAAQEMFGADYVEKILHEFNEKYGTNSSIQARVLTSDAPVIEAIRVMKEQNFYSKYGTDVDKIEGKIKEKLIEELTPKITNEVTKQLMERMNRKAESPEGLSETKGNGLIKDTKKIPQRKSLGTILSG